MITLKFLKSSLTYTIAGALPVASGLVLLPYYMKHLSTGVYGELSILLSISLLIQILVTYSFDTSLYIHYHEFKNDKRKLSVFISSSFIFILLMGLATGIVFLVCGRFIYDLFVEDKIQSFYLYGSAAVGAGIFQSIFKVYSNLVQTRQQPVTYFWSNVIMFSFIAGFSIGGLYIFPNSLMGPLVGRFLASFLVGIWALLHVFREFGYRFDFEWLKKSFAFNNYTFIYQIQQWILNYFDRILLVFFAATSVVGIYDFGLKLMIVLEVILNGLHNSYYPKVVSTIMAQPEKGSTVELNRYYYGTTSVVMILICLCILVYPFAFDFFISKSDYRESITYIPYIACLYLFKTMRFYFAVPYGILKVVKLLPVSYLYICAVKIALMCLLIPLYSIYGIIAAALISAAVEIVVLQYFIAPKFKFQFNAYKLIVGPLVLLSLILVLEPLVGIKFPFLTHVSYLLVCFGLLFWLYRNEIGLIIPFRQIKKI